MADDLTYSGSGASVPSNTKQVTDEHATRGHMPVVKFAYSADGVATHVPADAEGLRVNLGENNDVTVVSLPLPSGAATAANQGVLIGHVDTIESGLALLLTELGQKTGPTDTQPISHAALIELAGAIDTEVQCDIVGPLPAGTNNIGDVDVSSVPAPLSTTGGGTEAAALRVTIANDSTGVLSVDDNGGSLTVDGPLTNAELRASAVPVSLAGGATLAEQQTQSASLSVLDDWDESDRAKVNPIVGQAGVAGGSGVVGATTQRVVLAIDVPLPVGTNAIGKLAPNSGVDIGDVDVLSVTPGSGATNLGKAIDSPVGANDVGALLLAVRDDATTTLTEADGDYTPLKTNSRGELHVNLATRLDSSQDTVGALGNVGHDAVDAGAAVKIGFRADLAFQTAVADGDRVDALADVYGVQVVRNDHPNRWSYHEDSSSALTDTEVKAAPGAGVSIYITDISVSTGVATAFNFFLEEGTSKVLGPIYLEAAAGRGYVVQFRTPKKITANTAITITTNAAIAHSVDIQGFIAP